MPRFTFTRGLSNNPSSEDYNQIVTDFKDFIHTTKLSEENLENKSVRYRHIVSPPTILLAKDCSEEIWNADADFKFENIGRYDEYGLYRDTKERVDTRLKIDYTGRDDSIGGHPLLEFNIWYYPYTIHSKSKIAPGIRIAATGEWVAVPAFAKHAGAVVGFHTKYSQPAYTGSRLNVPGESLYKMRGKHPFFTEEIPYGTGGSATGEARFDRLGTVAYGGPIICTMSLGKAGIGGYKLDEIDAYGMMIKHDRTLDSYVGGYRDQALRNSRVSRHDRLFLSLVVREA